MRALIILSLFGLLFLTSCGGQMKVGVHRADGAKVGEILFEDDDNSTIVGNDNDVRGRVRGTLVRSDNGGKAGEIQTRNNVVVIVDAGGNDVGSLEKGLDCYGKGQEKLGTMSTGIDIEAAGAACLLLLLPR